MVITTSYCGARTFTYYSVAVRVDCKYANKIFNKVSVNNELQGQHNNERFRDKTYRLAFKIALFNYYNSWRRLMSIPFCVGYVRCFLRRDYAASDGRTVGKT
jgi:hypothetical protein